MCLGAGMSSARVDYTAPWWTFWLHNFPHIDLRFQPVDNSFRPEEEKYQQVSGRLRDPGWSQDRCPTLGLLHLCNHPWRVHHVLVPLRTPLRNMQNNVGLFMLCDSLQGQRHYGSGPRALSQGSREGLPVGQVSDRRGNQAGSQLPFPAQEVKKSPNCCEVAWDQLLVD